ncbi:TenA family protein [Aureimonas sp. D3]|uniref:TenA family protein n=1 Tax=Aureimonas sp. D3 TaxID=1638164 RepID=UPI000B32B684|nr:TenA family protein [Aureimonas sp. D3]
MSAGALEPQGVAEPASITQEKRFSERLRAAAEPDWTVAVTHRFTRELMSGTLAPDVMARYLVQDHRFLDPFLMLLGAAMATSDRFESRLRLARFAGLVAGEENTYFERAFEALGVSPAEREATPDTAATSGFQAIMREAVERRSYAAALSVLTVAEWLYLDWASRAPQPLPGDFVHREWITLHDNPGFRDFVAFLRSELDRVGPEHHALCEDLFRRAVALERAFFEAAYGAEAS